MELLYNPDSMLEEEIKATFVARHDLINELVSLIEHQPDGAGVQHIVIIAPRGMGKTTVLLMVQFAIRDSELAMSWQAVRFAEESYHVYDLADLWIEALSRLAAETDDPALLEQVEKLKTQYRDNDDLQEAALALIKDWRRKHQKRLVILVDNFDMILEQINDERDNARLRDVLMNDGTMMLIGCATTFFREARAYEQPLYNFFKIINLGNLRFAEMQELLRRRADIDQIPDFEEKLKANESRLRVLEYFTGGSPRLVLMLYRIVTQSDISEVRRGLEKLLDEVTPYYKAKVESLPAQQRKILDHIARVSGQTREGVTPSEIAKATRLKANHVSSQLKRLSELGYVRAANLRERNSYYTLSEPLYAIWHQMRFGREARQRMQWLIDFLKVWYDAAEMDVESGRLAVRFREHLSAGRLHEARNALDYRRYLAEAMDDSSAKANTLDAVICSYLELKDFETLKKEVLTPVMLRNLSSQTLNLLLETNCISDQDFNHAKAVEPSSAEAQQQAEATAATELGIMAIQEGRINEAIQHFNRALDFNPDSDKNWALRGVALGLSKRYEEAIENYDRALELNPNSSMIWYNKGTAFIYLENYEEAIKSFNRALEIEPTLRDALINRGAALYILGKYPEAIESYDRALEIEPEDHEVLRKRGTSLRNLERYEEAITSYDQAIKIKPDDNITWFDRSYTLNLLKRYEEAIESYDRVLEIKPDDYQALNNRGAALSELNRYEEAVNSFDMALQITAGPFAWFNRGRALHELGRYEEAVSSYEHGLRMKSDEYQVWYWLGNTLSELGKYEEAVANYKRALEIKPDDDEIWSNLGYALARLNKHEEAMNSFDHSLHFNPNRYEAWVNRGNELAFLDKYEEAIASYDHATKGDSLIDAIAHLMKFRTRVKQNKIDLAKADWKRALKAGEQLERESWVEMLSRVLMGLAREGHLKIVRQLISESELDEPLFPLARSLDYLLTGDEALIEKLSPEVRNVVEEIVSKLSNTAAHTEQPQVKSRVPKSKSNPRRRTRKQLR